MSAAPGPGGELEDELPELSDEDTNDITPDDVLRENFEPPARARVPWHQDDGFQVRRWKPYRKDEHDAITRRRLAYWVLTIVSVLYGAAILGMICHWIDMDELGRIALVLGPIQALAAAVLGFYFGRDNKA